MSAVASVERVVLALTADDPLLFGDGRPLEAGAHPVSGLPSPQTVAGALTTHLLRAVDCDLGELAAVVKRTGSFGAAAKVIGGATESVAAVRFSGPWLMRDSSPLMPVPAALRRVEESGEIVRLDPAPAAIVALSAIPPAKGRWPLWARCQKRLERIEGYVDQVGLARYLEGGVPAPDSIIPPHELYGYVDRTGIALDAERGTAAEGQIYAKRMLVLRPGVSFRVEVHAPAEVCQRLTAEFLLPFGGEGRLVQATRIPNPDDWPTPPAQAGSATLLVALTPALSHTATSRAARSAAIDATFPVSGWDLARGGPKPARFAAAAGSVFFFDGQPWPAATPALAAADDARVGWGMTAMGYWNDG